jgi:hypothetical protein
MDRRELQEVSASLSEAEKLIRAITIVVDYPTPSIKECRECGNEFIVGYRKEMIFCSPKCCDKYWSRNRVSTKHQQDRRKESIAKWRAMNREKIKAYSQARRKAPDQTVRECPLCHSPFVQGVYSHKKYCSVSCRSKYRKVVIAVNKKQAPRTARVKREEILIDSAKEGRSRCVCVVCCENYRPIKHMQKTCSTTCRRIWTRHVRRENWSSSPASQRQRERAKCRQRGAA